MILLPLVRVGRQKESVPGITRCSASRHIDFGQRLSRESSRKVAFTKPIRAEIMNGHKCLVVPKILDISPSAGTITEDNTRAMKAKEDSVDAAACSFSVCPFLRSSRDCETCTNRIKMVLVSLFNHSESAPVGRADTRLCLPTISIDELSPQK